MTPSHRWRLFGGALLAIASSRASQAQAGLTGRVFDATDNAVVSRVDLLIGDKVVARSDGLGTYRVTLPPGFTVVGVRLLGYRPMQTRVFVRADTTLTLDIYLERVPQMLSQVKVQGHAMRVPAGFEYIYRRANMVGGQLLSRERIDSVNPRDVRGLLQHETNLHIRENGVITSGRCPGRVDVWLNGIRLPTALATADIVDHLSPRAIQAVEVYAGASRMPPDLAASSSCGAVVAWTRGG